jgi:Uma2 family endonuclease
MNDQPVHMPPCGDTQQDVTGSVAGILDRWLDDHGEFTFGTKEAGVMLGEEVRGADAAVWLRSDVTPHTGGYRTVPPILAVEVAGQDEGEIALRAKAGWYLDRGVKVVWIVLPDPRQILVARPGGESRFREGERLPPHPDLPGLEPEVGHFFRRL